MERNLFKQKGLMMSECVMMHMAPRLGRMTAHEIIYKGAMEALRKKIPFKDVLMNTPAVKEEFTEEEIDHMLNPHSYIGLAPEFVDRVLCQVFQNNFLSSGCGICSRISIQRYLYASTFNQAVAGGNSCPRLFTHMVISGTGRPKTWKLGICLPSLLQLLSVFFALPLPSGAIMFHFFGGLYFYKYADFQSGFIRVCLRHSMDDFCRLCSVF